MLFENISEDYDLTVTATYELINCKLHLEDQDVSEITFELPGGEDKFVMIEPT